MINKKITALGMALLIASSSLVSLSGASVASAATRVNAEVETSLKDRFFNSNFWKNYNQRKVSISEITPETGPTGTEVTLTGKGFKDDSIVRFGQGMITNTDVSDDGKTLSFTVPEDMGKYCAPNRVCTAIAYEVTPDDYKVQVQNGYRMSNAVWFEVTEDETNPDPVAEVNIESIVGPLVLMTNEEGTWDLEVESMNEGNLQYSVKWGDEGTGLMRMLGLVDEEIQTSSSFTHTYQNPGTYQPEFTVTDSEGNTVTKKAEMVVVSSETAIPEIKSISQSSGSVGATITLSGTGFDADSVVMIGAQTATNTKVVNQTKITFMVPQSNLGTYLVSVKDNDGTSNTVEFTIKETVKTGKVSISGINAPNRLVAGQVGTWTVDAKTNLSGNLQYSVNWGEGTTQKGMNSVKMTTQSSATFTHAYDQAGKYKPTFTVTNAEGNTATVGASVSVSKVE